MELCLIHADGSFHELCQITEFDSFSASVTIDPDKDCDWELIMPEGAWNKCPIHAGHYIYIEGSEWGGPVERVRHVSSEALVKLSGICWRGLLRRRVIAPASGQTHVILEKMDANSAIAFLLDGWRADLFRVSSVDSGLVCSASLRYEPLLEALDNILGDTEGRLSVCFSGGTVTLSAVPSRDMSEQVELSQEYDAQLISDSSVRLYDHIIALGRGEMEERQVVELWLNDDDTVTDDPSALSDRSRFSTLLYDYPAVESLEDLQRSARRKLLDQAGRSSMEIEMTDDVGLELTDRASVRDALTGMTASLRVISRDLNISHSGTVITHRLGA